MQTTFLKSSGALLSHVIWFFQKVAEIFSDLVQQIWALSKFNSTPLEPNKKIINMQEPNNTLKLDYAWPNGTMGQFLKYRLGSSKFSLSSWRRLHMIGSISVQAPWLSWKSYFVRGFVHWWSSSWMKMKERCRWVNQGNSKWRRWSRCHK